MIDAIDSLRELVPTMDRAWYAKREDVAADAVAADVCHVLAALAKEAEPDILALGLDPSDREGLRWAVPHPPPVTFYLACYDAIAAFKYWRDEGDFAARLDAVELAATKWLHGAPPALPVNDIVRHTLAEAHDQRVELGERLSDAWSARNMEQQAKRAQQAGIQRVNADRKRPVQVRAARAWEALGKPEPAKCSLITAARERPEVFMTVYGYDDADAFRADALDENSSLRGKLKRDTTALRKL